MPSNTESCVVWQVRFHHRQVFGSTSMCFSLHQCASSLFVISVINLSMLTLLKSSICCSAYYSHCYVIWYRRLMFRTAITTRIVSKKARRKIPYDLEIANYAQSNSSKSLPLGDALFFWCAYYAHSSPGYYAHS